MRVAIFTDTYPPQINGVGISSRNLYRVLKEHGHEVKVFTTNPYGLEFLEDGDIIRIPGIELKKLYGYRLSGFYNHKAMEIFTSFKPDVIHIQTEMGIGIFGSICASRIKCATVYTFHTMYEDYTYYISKGILVDRALKKLIREYVKHKSNVVNEFITPSEKIKDYMRNVGVDSYINVIPTGIDFGIYKKENIDIEKLNKLKEQLGITKDTYVLLSLGRVAKEKSIDICLEGYAKYLSEHPDKKTLFICVGGGPALDSLKDLVTKLGITENVRFIGPVSPEEVPLYYHLGDMFVSASITETQGLTFMEAMAANLILLCRYDDTLKDTIEDNKDGFFFQDEEDMAKKIANIISLSEEQKEKIKINANERLKPYFLETFYERIHHVYERAIKKNW